VFAGGEQVVVSESDLDSRTHDVTRVIYGPKPLAAVYVESEADIVKVMKWANAEKVKVIPFAGWFKCFWTADLDEYQLPDTLINQSAGSSLEGHIVPMPPPLNTFEPTIVLDCSKMDQLVQVRTQDLDCDVQPGIGWMELERLLKPTGLCGVAFEIDA
jgi:D-lactate dehydrogenase (cytochrome)